MSKLITVITHKDLGWDCVVGVVEGDDLEATAYLNTDLGEDMSTKEYEEEGYFFHFKHLIEKDFISNPD